MSDASPSYPVLLFGRSVIVEREKLGSGVAGKPPRRPGAAEQQQRLGGKWAALQQALVDRRAAIAAEVGSADPEVVLVMEIVGNVPSFVRAVRKIEGFEFLADLDEEGIDDEAFIDPSLEDQSSLDGTLYLLAANQTALGAVLDLWQLYQRDETAPFPYGFAPWKDVFRLLVDLRRWGPQDRLRGTGAVEDFAARAARREVSVPAEIELWYRNNAGQRAAAERTVRQAVAALGGEVLAAAAIDPIAYHALLVRLPVVTVQPLLEGRPDEVQLIRAEEIAFVRPEAQAAVTLPEPEQVTTPFPIDPVQVSEEPPLVGVLDGLPLAGHSLLDDRLVVDDPDGWTSTIAAGARQHGTAVASLVLHGDRNSDHRSPRRRVYARPVLIPEDAPGTVRECIPHDRLAVDLVHRSVIRMVDNRNGNARAPEVRLINLSLGDATGQLATTLSPWARLLDYLAYEFRLLFIVSAGNHLRPLTYPYPLQALKSMSDEQMRLETLRRLVDDAAFRRILSPSEAVSCLTVGSSYDDACETWTTGARRDVLPASAGGVNALPSPVTAAGMGYRRCIKPDLLAPGGRTLFRPQPAAATAQTTTLEPAPSDIPPGLMVATPSPHPGGLSGARHFHGTSGAAALVSHHGALVLEALADYVDDRGRSVDPRAWSVLAKTLLVHSCALPPAADELRRAFGQLPPHRLKDAVSRLYGYGIVDPSRLFEGTASRATAIGWGEIAADEGMRFDFPLPPSLSGKVAPRRLIVTVGYFPPIRPRDRRHRAAELFVRPDKETLGISRVDADWRTVKRGSVQHEILSGDSAAAFVDGTAVAVQVNCRSIIEPMKGLVPFGLAVTLDVEAELPIYAEVATRIRAQARARVR